MTLTYAKTVEFKTYSVHIKTMLDLRSASGATICELVTSRRAGGAVEWVDLPTQIACSIIVGKLNRVGKPRRRRHDAN